VNDADHYFPPGESLLRHVHRQRAVGLLYGQRALGIGAIAPLNFVGTLLHTRALGKPFQRLVHTAKMFETIFFGTREEADEVLRIVDRMHQRVHGVLPEDAGPVPAGTPYSAFDPEMMLWTVAVMADSAVCFYELLVEPLAPAQRDRLWDEYVRFAELFGMPRDVAPSSWAQFADYMDARINGPDAHLTDEARITGHAIMFQIPVPALQRPGMRGHNFVIAGSLPPRVRELYEVPWTAAHETGFRALTRALRATRPAAPRAMRAGWNTRFFDGVADSERALLRQGRPVPGALVERAARAT
jgi:uncharacterized protein (DUF2236 family)